ncbi:interleukin-1 receptor-associated kinase 3 isoform X1 [Polypterus senegalus]|uniref:interleukin-1 receptor-associated kinase 3 isoform X1 n=1 Tax=Polypterus senegalus TaxID=55291 RepID=UPI001962B573|nr:interleukin-1 receptor-associated kinase 3 isoform X1 [Polypterus senegalus]
MLHSVSGAVCLSTPLFDVPPSLIEEFCKILDCSDGRLGWRGLAERVLPNWLEVRYFERLSEQGKSQTRELLWQWAQRNKTVGDLLLVLKDMGHQRAISLFMQGDSVSFSVPKVCDLVKPETNPAQTRCSKGDNNVFSPVDYKPPCTAPTVNLHQDDSAIQLTDPKVIAEATQNFHSDQKIGEGMFSEIYKGVIQNKLFAIKVLKQEKQSDWKKLWQVFLSEVEVLLMYRHPHILELVGYCSDEERYCLVYPFMQNGSLHTKLQCKDKTMGLPWQLRLNIIKGIAKAVHFLHTAQPCSVICGNITSANILLNEYFEPKLTDFALARLRPHTANQSCTITLDSDTRQMMGYWPEEYIRDGKLSVKLDVFSFGVVILEVLTGKKPVLEDPKYTLLRNLVTETVKENGSVDNCLPLLDEKAGAWPHLVSLRLFSLALECTSSRVKTRPIMKTVSKALEELSIMCYETDDQPRTLKETVSPVSTDLHRRHPVENDEIQDSPLKWAGPNKPPPNQHIQGRERSVPCECSQSEVTFIGITGCQNATPSKSPLNVCVVGQDEKNSWLPKSFQNVWGPVECSCTAENSKEECLECRANGFLSNTPVSGSDCEYSMVVENTAKVKFMNKIQRYKQGELTSEELLSITPVYQEIETVSSSNLPTEEED